MKLVLDKIQACYFLDSLLVHAMAKCKYALKISNFNCKHQENFQFYLPWPNINML